MSTQLNDDLDAVREIAKIMEPFKPAERERIIRWVLEKLGMNPSRDSVSLTATTNLLDINDAGLAKKNNPSIVSHDIKSFISEKNPRNDVQFAAAVAYYHRFIVSESHQKASIGPEDLQEACRKAVRERLSNPGNTLANAFKLGLLDRADRGKYSINAVGENLVAMVLPDGDKSIISRPKKNASIKKSTTKSKKAIKNSSRAKR